MPSRIRTSRAARIAGPALLVASCAAMAAAGPDLVAAATWAAERGGPVPRWLLGPFGEGLGLDGGAFYALLWAAFAGYLLTVLAAPALGRRAVAALAAGLIGLLVVAPPLLSQDVFSYIAYARLGAEHGLNPYESPPVALGPDPVAPFVGWLEAISVYGPLFTVASYAVAPLSVGASLWTMKAVAGLAVGGTALLVDRLAARRGVDRARAVAFVALNPLVLVHVVGGAHNDALMALALTASIGLALSAREASGGAMLAAAAAVKLSALFVAPFAVLGRLRRGRLLAGGMLAGAAITALSALAFGAGALESLAVAGQSRSETTHYSVPATLSRLLDLELGAVRTVLLAGFALLVARLAAWTWRGGDWVRAAGWAGLATLLATGWLLPWYVVWVLPLAAISRDNVLAGLLLALTAFQLVSRVPL